MFRRPLRRTLAVLVVSLALATPLCEAASRATAPHRAGRVSPASHLPGPWDWVRNVWAKAGCSIDPGGACAPGPAPAALGSSGNSLDEGCSIDPGGRTCGGHS
jgi:hypothetical protein